MHGYLSSKGQKRSTTYTVGGDLEELSPESGRSSTLQRAVSRAPMRSSVPSVRLPDERDVPVLQAADLHASRGHARADVPGLR
jgi:hypothetical protein